MQTDASRESTIAVLLWLFLGVCIATGCGNDDPRYTIQLENGYQLTEWSWGESYIQDPDGVRVSDQYFSITGFATSNWIVYGVYHDPNDPNMFPESYFILNMKTSSYSSFMEVEQWRETLEKMGVDSYKLKTPKGVRMSRFFYSVVGVGFLILVSARRSNTLDRKE